MNLSSRIAFAATASVLIMACAFGAAAQVSTTTVTVTAATSATSTCPLVTTFMKLGAPNKASDVAKLQAFLKGSQGLDVDVTGIFDQKTEDAVKAFQRAHMSDIMGPWGATQASGIVYLTTLKKVNQIACSVPLTLDQNEASIISAYRAAADERDLSMSAGTTSALAPQEGATDADIVPGASAAQPLDMSAGAGDAAEAYDLDTIDERSIWMRFGAYLSGLFSR